jgi:galactokinase/mevalonate kinase-like predicted kinase
LWAIHSPFQRLASEPNLCAAEFAEQVQTRAEAAEAIADLARGLGRHPALDLRARALILARLLSRRARSLPEDLTAQEEIDAAVQALTAGAGSDETLGPLASAAVAAWLATHTSRPATELRAAILPDQVIWATAPARLDFAGGWSDTPPICNDRGGVVVNAAVRLNGQYPIQAVVKLNEQHNITLTSIDLGHRIEIDRIEELLAYTDPGQWDSLPKACLCLMGFTGGQRSGELAPVLRPFGGGIDLTLFSALPKGSGLGTSSILGAAVLGSLGRLTGQNLSQEQLIQQTSLLEQLMTTGGGWQDQIGGIVPGVKLIRTQPGVEQVPAIFWLAFDQHLSGNRLLLYYTGLKRLAKNILQNVVHTYLARDRVVLDTVERLKAGALQLAQAIGYHDLDRFGEEVLSYWELKKRLDPGSTTPPLERLIARVRDLCTGYSLLGAGGGGFLLMVAGNEECGRRIRADLTAVPSAPGARFFDFAVDEQGLSVCVL